MERHRDGLRVRRRAVSVPVPHRRRGPRRETPGALEHRRAPPARPRLRARSGGARARHHRGCGRAQRRHTAPRHLADSLARAGTQHHVQPAVPRDVLCALFDAVPSLRHVNPRSASVWCEPNSARLEYLCSHSRGRACRAASPTLRMVAVVQTSLSALLNDAAVLEEVRRRARCLSRAPNPHALRVRTRDTAKALDSSPIESRRNSRSDLRPPARSPHRSSAASRRRWRFPSSARARSSPRATRRTPPTRTTTC